MPFKAFGMLCGAASGRGPVESGMLPRRSSGTGAIKGASAERAGTMRRLLDELAVLNGLDAVGICWDVHKFYDSLE